MIAGQFIWLTRETIYHVSIAELTKRNLKSQVAELVCRPRVLMKILYINEHQQFPKNHRGKNLYMTGVEEILFVGRAGIILDREGNFIKIVDRGN